MADGSLAALLQTQKSLTEWLHDIKHADAEVIRREDNDKRERLKVLSELIDLPFDRPTQFEAADLSTKSAVFMTYLNEHSEELCALRLIPKEAGLPKLRMRGKTVEGAYDWFLEQNIDPFKYRADFIPHVAETTWSTIFIVNQHGIQGEVIAGGHHQLTQGFHDNERPIVFRYDFKRWTIEPQDEAALEHLQKVAAYLHVDDASVQKKLQERLQATFSHNYLEGYFETTDSRLGTWFIDYSPVLGALYGDVVIAPRSAKDTSALVSGQTGSAGKASGQVCIVQPDNLAIDFPDGAILVCPVTTPAYVPLMQKAAAIVTDQGGILSHAAIVARELKKPCIVGARNATQVLHDIQAVTVDADSGNVYISS